ncbi:hypothetical protein KKD19_06045 [Patescibacteria group bacterium]|nr:hypothetical protein [Patescibacteria group bacterium]MBU4512765.1 hypothetical protein [Patescibacteria group bacterium]MCG2693104.1 hypothetical protein [Candidatus Parcubacteria bacterium]
MPNKKPKPQFSPPNANKDDYEMEAPKWWECQWRRIPCGKDECPFCGRRNRQIKKHLARGEDPDSMKAVFEDVEENFKEVGEMLRKDAKRMGIDLNNLDDADCQPSPEPDELPLYNQVYKWQRSLMLALGKAGDQQEPWTETEDFKDLVWYSGTLLAKTYRQLTSKWEADQGDEYALGDYDYTRYIMNESIKIMEQALDTAKRESYFHIDFSILADELDELKMEVLLI